MNEPKKITNEQEALAELCKVFDILLGENGCPWDKEQTHQSLRKHLLEESYETADAIDSGDIGELKEELGDVLMQIVFHAKIAERSGEFNLAEVITGITEKLVSRHTHIFGEEQLEVKTADDVVALWEDNKIKEKKLNSVQDNLKAVPKALPALMRAQKVIKRVGVTDDNSGHFKAIRSVLNDLENGIIPSQETFGRLLFEMAWISEKNNLDAEFSLTNAIEAFINESIRQTKYKCTAQK